VDGTDLSITSDDLYARVGTAALLLLGVHRSDAFKIDDRLILGAIRRAMEGSRERRNSLILRLWRWHAGRTRTSRRSCR
jgi:hypothetical protein